MPVICYTPKNWGPLSESGQTYRNFFAFARKEGENIKQLHPWVKCRDYLLDGLFWKKDKTLYKKPVYGYPYIEDVNLEELELLFQCPKGNIIKNLHILNQMEEELGITPTEVESLGNNVYYIKGDKWWNRSTIHLSIISLLIRTLSYVECSSWEEMEKKIQPNFIILVKRIKPLLLALKDSNYESVHPIGDINDANRHDPVYLHATAGAVNFVSSVMNNFTSSFKYGDLVNAYKSRIGS